MPKGFSFTEEAKLRREGKSTNYRIQWNHVKLGNTHITVERPVLAPEKVTRIKIEDIHFTFAYVKKQNKDRCALCKMWFEKSSVVYKVPQHRLIDLQKKWNCHNEGRRYSTASFLYATTSVCMLCSQFFDDGYECSQNGLDELQGMPKSPTLNKTIIARTNIAPNPMTRVYASSMVDNFTAEKAIEVPYLSGFKSR